MIRHTPFTAGAKVVSWKQRRMSASFNTRHFGPQLFDDSVDLVHHVPHSEKAQQQPATHTQR